MKTINLLVPALVALAVVGCSPSATTTDQKSLTDSTNLVTVNQTDTSLTAKISLPQTVAEASPVEMTFTVYNKTDSTRTFCKWHTPFEPLMSKYLDIKNVNGEEAIYQGPMAKRMMPPPADSYVSVKPGDSLAVKVDLRNAYNIKGTGKFTVRYNAENISGLKATDSVSFTIK